MRRRECMKTFQQVAKKNAHKVTAGALCMAMVSGIVLSPMGDLNVKAATYPYNVMQSQALLAAVPDVTNMTVINVGNMRDPHLTITNETAYFNITEDGTYRLTGSNLINGVYVETQIAVKSGVHATLILDNLQIKNQKGKVTDGGSGSVDVEEEGTAALLVNGTADVCVSANSTLETGFSSNGCVAIEKGGSLTMDDTEKAGTLSIISKEYCPGIGIDGDFTMKDGSIYIESSVGIGYIKEETQDGDINIEGGELSMLIPENEEFLSSSVGIYCGGNADWNGSLLISGGSIAMDAADEKGTDTGIWVKGQRCEISGGEIRIGSKEKPMYTGIGLYGNNTFLSGGIIDIYGAQIERFYALYMGKITGGQVTVHPADTVSGILRSDCWRGGNFLVDGEQNTVESGTAYPGTLSDVTEAAKLLSAYAIPTGSENTPIAYGVKDAQTTADGQFCLVMGRGESYQAFVVTFLVDDQVVTKKYNVGKDANDKYVLTESDEAQTVHKVTIHNLDTNTDETIYSTVDGTILYPEVETLTGCAVYYGDEEMTTSAPATVSDDTTTVYVKEKPYAQIEVRDYTTDAVVDTIIADRTGRYTLPDSMEGYTTYKFYRSNTDKGEASNLVGAQQITQTENQKTIIYLDAVKTSYTVTFQDVEKKVLKVVDCEYGDAVSYPEEEGYVYMYDPDSYYYDIDNLASVSKDMTFTVYQFEKYQDEKGKEYIKINSEEDFIKLCSAAREINNDIGLNVYLNTDLVLNTGDYQNYLANILYGCVLEGNGHTISLTHADKNKEFNSLLILYNATIQNLKLAVTITGKMPADNCMGAMVRGNGNRFINCSLAGQVAPSAGIGALCYERTDSSDSCEEVFVNCTLQGTTDVPTALLCCDKQYDDNSTVKIKNCFVDSAQASMSTGVINKNNPWYLQKVPQDDYNTKNVTVSIENSGYTSLGYTPTYDDENTIRENNEYEITSRKEAANLILTMGAQSVYGVSGIENDVQIELLQFNENAKPIHTVTFYDGNEDQQILAGVSGDAMTTDEQALVGTEYYYTNADQEQVLFDPAKYTYDQDIKLFKSEQNVEPQVKAGVNTELTVLYDMESSIDLGTFLEAAPEGYQYAYAFADATTVKYWNLIDQYSIEAGTLKIMKTMNQADEVPVVVTLMKGEKSLGQATITLTVRAEMDEVAPVIKNGTKVLDTLETGYTYCSGQTFTVEDAYLDTVLYDGKELAVTDHTVTINVAEGQTTTGLKALTATDTSGNSTTVYVCIDKGTHKWGDWSTTREATYDAEGVETRECSVCHKKETRKIDKLVKPTAPETTKKPTTETTTVKKGETKTVSNMKYKVTKVASNGTGTVTMTGTTKSKKITSLTIPATIKINGKTFKVTGINAKAYKNFKKLKKVTIGANVTSIGKETFYGCKSLKTITIKSTKLKSVSKNAIKGINSKATIKVPKSMLKKYKSLFKTKTGYKKTMKIKK